MSWASSVHLVPLEEFSNDSLWTRCKCFYSSASVDHSSHVFTGGEVCFAEDRFGYAFIEALSLWADRFNFAREGSTAL
jgi:hypothetical protein